MPTVEQIARMAKAELDSDINLQIVGNFVSQKITELYAKTKFKALRRLGELPLSAALGGQTNAQGVNNPNGTVTVTVGSNIVTGDTLAASFFNNTLEGQFFRVWQLKTWYRIAKVDPPNLMLENAMVSESNAQFVPGVPMPGESYYVVPRFFPAAPDARFFGKFVLDYLYQEVQFISPDRMQELYPSRFLVGPYPWCVSEYQSQLTQTNQPKMLEFYPAPLTATIVHYVYYAQPLIVNFSDDIPVTLDQHIAKELAFVPMLRHDMMKAVRAGQIEAAGLLRNEMRTQDAKAQALIDQAIRNDSGVDDETFIMRNRSRRRKTDYDPLQTAEADVWSRVG